MDGDDETTHASGEPRPFEVPLPPGFPPPLPPGVEGEPGDVVFFMHAPPPGGPKDAEDIMLRRVPAATAKRFRQAAGGRNLTHAQYLTTLVSLHDAMRALAEAGDERVAAELERLTLQTVSV